MEAYRLWLRIAGFAFFRWEGEYTWVTTGPTAFGATEPLPLPSSIIGVLLGTKPKAELEEASRALLEKLKCGGSVWLRGPYYPHERNEAIAIHSYPNGLLVVGDNGGIIGFLNRITSSTAGTALQRNSKTVARGMLYSAQFVDAVALEVKRLRPEVSVDVIGDCKRVERTTVKLGGEMRLAVLGSDSDARLYRLVENLAAKTEYYVVASPLVVTDEEKARRLISGERAMLDSCFLQPASRREVEEIAGSVGEGVVKRLRLRVEVLSPGVYGSTGFPRRPYPMIMPGSVLRVECSKERILKGLGLYSELGFGTLVPLRY